jgi:hypothetical protein
MPPVLMEQVVMKRAHAHEVGKIGGAVGPRDDVVDLDEALGPTTREGAPVAVAVLDRAP